MHPLAGILGPSSNWMCGRTVSLPTMGTVSGFPTQQKAYFESGTVFRTHRKIRDELGARPMDHFYLDRVLSCSHGLRRHIFDAGLAQELCCFFGRRGIDVEAGAPFEACRLGQLGHEFDVPVVVLVAGPAPAKNGRPGCRPDYRVRGRLASAGLSARARFSNICEDEFSNADSWRLGRIQVSKGKRGAYGASVMKSSFSLTTRIAVVESPGG